MKRITYALKDEYGMHARPASKLAGLSQNYQSSVEIRYKEKTCNLKSMISILRLGIKNGECFDIEIDGEDEEEAYHAMEEMLKAEAI